MSSPVLRVEVVWATRAVQDVVQLELPVGTTVAEAIAASRIVERYDLSTQTLRAGIRGRLAGEGILLADGDRIDLCRPLVADPKEARRQRVGTRTRQDRKTVLPA